MPSWRRVTDTIRNASIRSRETFAEITVECPLAADPGVAAGGLHDGAAAGRDVRG